MSDCVMTVSVD